MTNMPGNPHYHKAVSDIRAIENSDGMHSPEAHATLALAYEQRTANLIAAHRLLWENGDGHWVEAERQILARLGLEAP